MFALMDEHAGEENPVKWFYPLMLVIKTGPLTLYHASIESTNGSCSQRANVMLFLFLLN